MRNLTLGLAIIVGLVLAPLAVLKVEKLTQRAVSEESVAAAYRQQALPAATNVTEPADAPKVLDVQKIITLEDSNTVILKGPVTTESVSATMRSLQAASRRLSKDTPIYLVLDTPGGSISDGMDLIDFAKALPQKVHTVTLFAASMGFQIAQGLNNRYVIRTGTLMSHRARMEGLGGQVKGELESRYQMIRRDVDYLDMIASQRMGLDLKTYESKIFNELWIHGYDAIGEKAADEQVLVKCGETLKGSFTVGYNTMFGLVQVTFSKCPLIKTPESIALGNVKQDNRHEAEEIITESLNNQTQFVTDYILTNKFYTIFK